MIIQNILVIDNDTVFRSSLKVFLENHKYKVGEAGSVKEAIKNDLMAFNAIVSDGEANLDIIKLALGVPVIVTSSKASLRSAIEVMKLGAANYLPKPYNLDELKKLAKWEKFAFPIFFSTPKNITVRGS